MVHCRFFCAGALVVFEVVAYTVEEDVEGFEICLRVDSPDIECPILFPFEVVFAATHDTAGLH